MSESNLISTPQSETVPPVSKQDGKKKKKTRLTKEKRSELDLLIKKKADEGEKSSLTYEYIANKIGCTLVTVFNHRRKLYGPMKKNKIAEESKKIVQKIEQKLENVESTEKAVPIQTVSSSTTSTPNTEITKN